MDPLGHTVLYGEYRDDDAEVGAQLNSDEFTLGLGCCAGDRRGGHVVWLSYRHIERQTATLASTLNFDDFQYVKAGALINF